MTVTVEFPLTLPSVANLREHWATKAKRVKAQRFATRMYFGASHLHIINTPGFGPNGIWDGWRVTATLVRVAPRRLDDDNLRGAFKAVRDEVAAYFGVDDADPRLEWRYAQAKGPAAVRIELRVEVLAAVSP